jgi:glucose-1-phosphate adenylyltransferase
MQRPTTLAMILAGGRVDELGVLTHYRPKSAVPFGGFARVIDFPLSNLMHSHIERIAILSQYRSYSLINHIGTGSAWDMIGRHRGISILPPFKDYESPHWYRGSADAVYQNIDFIRYHAPGEILVLSGDHIYQMDYRHMIRYHLQQDADLTAAFIPVSSEDASRFGIAEIEGEEEDGGRLLSYEEKPASPRGRWASLTVLCFKPQVLYDVLAANQEQSQGSYEFGRDIIPMMMRKNYRVYGYKFKGYWGYTRTVDEYWQTSMDLLGPAPKIDMERWGLRTNLEHRDIRDCQPLNVGAQGVLDNSMAYNGVTVDGQVKNSILFPGARVEAGAEVTDSVLFFNTVVKAGAHLSKVVSDVNTTFGAGCRIGTPGKSALNNISVIGWNNQVPAGMVIGGGCTVYPRIASENWPEKELADGEVLQ